MADFIPIIHYECLSVHHYLHRGGYVFVCGNLAVCLFLSWFVSRITETLPSRFPQNVDGGWVHRPHSLLLRVQIKGQIQELSLTFFNNVRYGIFQHFPSLKSGVFRWLVSLSEYNLSIIKQLDMFYLIFN